MKTINIYELIYFITYTDNYIKIHYYQLDIMIFLSAFNHMYLYFEHNIQLC